VKTEFGAMMTDYYKPCGCEHGDIELADDGEDFVEPAFVQPLDIDELLEKALKEVYDDPAIISAILYSISHDAIRGAVELNFVSNTLLKEALLNNAAVFAAAKTEQQCRELASLVSNDFGQKVGFGTFRKLASQIVENYNKVWLRTEYVASVRLARMASNWAVAQQSASVYPNIEYVRSRSAEPRIDHLRLVGVVRPINDPFWLTYLPINDWGCKCSFRPTDKEVTALPETLPEIPLVFRNNAGITGELFTKDHPYFQAVGLK
jgi:Phage Mu protein F like protein